MSRSRSLVSNHTSALPQFQRDAAPQFRPHLNLRLGRIIQSTARKSGHRRERATLCGREECLGGVKSIGDDSAVLETCGDGVGGAPPITLGSTKSASIHVWPP